MIKQLYTVLFFLILLSCKQKSLAEKLNTVRSDIRFGTKFYSIYLNEEGKAYVIKGKGSYYTETLKIESSDTSNVFKLDSIKLFFENLNRIRVNPVVRPNRLHFPRVEIYHNNQKIYDAYEWDDEFWSLFKPIMKQIPRGFNPFRVDDHPF